eukprot:6423102-Karenia_brevis.AAC.1
MVAKPIVDLSRLSAQTIGDSKQEARKAVSAEHGSHILAMTEAPTLYAHLDQENWRQQTRGKERGEC